MKNIFRIARWEFVTRFKSRSFLFSTFILPVLFSLLITLPILLVSFDSEVSTNLIGVINLSDSTRSVKDLQRFFNRNYRLENGSPEYIILPVSVDNSIPYKNTFSVYSEINARKDSIDGEYKNIKDLRADYYRRRNLPNKSYLLQKTYDELQQIREAKDLVEIELNNYKMVLDSVYSQEARKAADSLMINGIIDAYLVFPPDFLNMGIVEYHTSSPGSLLESERMTKILNELIIKMRIQDDGIELSQIRDWFVPANIKTYQLQSKGKHEWNFYVEFYGSVFGVILLFMAIFTSGGFLFSSVINEKSNRVIEILLSYANSKQIMAGKIFGLGFLGLIQVLIWLLITSLFVIFNLFNFNEIPYLNFENAQYFLLYFSLGYLLYASIFVAIGSIFSSEQEAQQITLVLRTLAIFPVLLVFMFLQSPNSTFISVLSYFPLFTPYFMIMRIFLSAVPLQMEIWLTTGVLLVSIFAMIFVAARIFKVGVLMYGKKLSMKEVFNYLFKD